MIEVDHLVKRFGAVTAVDGLSFTVRPGHVTGFLGPWGTRVAQRKRGERCLREL
jgi:ABC-type multidrug transport system ATPase subunit